MNNIVEFPKEKKPTIDERIDDAVKGASVESTERGLSMTIGHGTRDIMDEIYEELYDHNGDLMQAEIKPFKQENEQE